MIVDTETGEILSEVPAPAAVPEGVDPAMLAEWFELQKQLKQVKDREMSLRRQIFGAAFLQPVEGVNNFALDGGWVLKGKYVLNRKVDQGTLQVMRDKLEEAGISVDSLVEYKPELKITAYKKLDEEQMELFDQCLTVSPGSPALEIVMPKRGATTK